MRTCFTSELDWSLNPHIAECVRKEKIEEENEAFDWETKYHAILENISDTDWFDHLIELRHILSFVPPEKIPPLKSILQHINP